jgi:hypothetical protein
MAGLAATLNAPDSTAPLCAALTARGPEGSITRLDGPGGASLMIGVRAVIPSVARVQGSDAGPIVAAFAVDGVASVSALDAGYTSLGPPGLLGGEEPYAVILADVEQEALVLARNGNGPGSSRRRSCSRATATARDCTTPGTPTGGSWRPSRER